jgi:hypothetical protein
VYVSIIHTQDGSTREQEPRGRASEGRRPTQNNRKRTTGEGKAESCTQPDNSFVLCLFAILSARFFWVDEHAQGSRFGEFLV